MQAERFSGTLVSVSRRLSARPARVWQAFTNPNDMAKWMWGSKAVECVASSDLRVGGSYSVYADGQATQNGWHTDRVGRAGVYAEIIPRQRLVYTLHWDAPVGYNQNGTIPPDELFVVTFEYAGTGTLVEIEHHGIPDDGISAPEHERGLNDELDALAGLVEE